MAASFRIVGARVLAWDWPFELQIVELPQSGNNEFMELVRGNNRYLYSLIMARIGLDFKPLHLDVGIPGARQ